MPNITIKSDKPLIVISKETRELLSLCPNLLNELREERGKMDKGEYVVVKDYKKKYKTQ